MLAPLTLKIAVVKRCGGLYSPCHTAILEQLERMEECFEQLNQIYEFENSLEEQQR